MYAIACTYVHIRTHVHIHTNTRKIYFLSNDKPDHRSDALFFYLKLVYFFIDSVLALLSKDLCNKMVLNLCMSASETCFIIFFILQSILYFVFYA